MDKYKIAYLVAVAAALAASAVTWQFLIIAAAISLAYKMLFRAEKGTDAHELLAFAKEFRDASETEGLNAALARSIKSGSAPKELRELSMRLMLGHIGPAGQIRCDDANIRELMEIIEISAQRGSDIRKNLEIFVSRLESDMENSNQSTQSSMNMNTLSSLGISFFVPLFGGIGSSIISSSGAILGAAHASQALPFQGVVIAYIAVMSYIMSAFSRERGKSPLFSSFQTTVIGAGIIKACTVFMAYAI